MPTADPIIAKENPEPFWLQGFDGINLHDSRKAIGDQECAWLENFDPLGAGNARTMYDNATQIYTAAHTIVYDFTFNIGTTFYKALFLSDGSAVQVNTVSGASGTIATAGTFAVTPTLPGCAQWGASGIVIVSADANGYFAWDGTTFFDAGDFAPTWLQGSAAVSFTITGDTHSNTTVDNTVTANLRVGMKVTGSDIPAGTFVASISSGVAFVLSQAATGSNSSETLTVGWSMPTGIKGTAVEIYQQRVWVINGPQFSFSAPANGADFSTADGGGTVKSSDGFLRTAFVSIKQSNGFLYLFGDGSINVISNVQTSGSPATTTFNNQNVDPQTGLGWRDALAEFGRALIFANTNGVYALFGGAAEKISDKIDRLFQNADFVTTPPSAFIVSLFSVQCFGLVMNTLNPTTGSTQNLIALWNGSKWFVGTQTRNTIFANTVDPPAKSHQGWGNDGTHVYQLFNTPSSTLTKKIQTKLWSGQSEISGTLDSDTNASIAFNITSKLFWLNNSGGLIVFQNNTAGNLQFVSNPPGVVGAPNYQSGRRLGVTLTSTSPDFELIGVGETYRTEAPVGN